MTDTATAAPAAAAPAAAAGSPTHVTPAQSTGYQPATPPAQPAVGETIPKVPENTPLQQPAVETKPADPAAKPADAPAADPAKAADPAAAPATDLVLPDEYKDKPWAAKIKTQDDLYKQIENLTTLVGKKAVVPNLKEATAEEREAFYSQLRGKDAAEYPMPAGTSVPIPDDTQPAVAKMFMDNGISPVQAEGFLKEYLGLREKQIAQYYDPEGFKASMQTAFGADWEKTTGQVRNTIKGMMSPEDAKALDGIPNNLLGLVYRTLGNVVKSYGIKETDSAHFASTGKAAPTDVISQRQGLRDQLNALSMRPHTSAEQQSIIDQLNATYTHDPRLQQQG